MKGQRARKKAESRRVILVQSIETQWTRASRGGSRAVKRNAVPEAVEFPFLESPEHASARLHHSLCYEERAGFADPRWRVVMDAGTEPLCVGCVTIDGDADQ